MTPQYLGRHHFWEIKRLLQLYRNWVMAEQPLVPGAAMLVSLPQGTLSVSGAFSTRAPEMGFVGRPFIKCPKRDQKRIGKSRTG